MEIFQYLDIIEEKLRCSFDIQRNYSINDYQYDMYAEYHLRNEQYVLVKKAVVFAFENNEYSLIKHFENLNKDNLKEIIDTLIQSVELIVKPSREHMSSIVTLVIVTDNIFNEDIDEITKTVTRFNYNKGFAFGFKGWADIRLVLVSLNEGLIATNKKGKEVIEVYGF